MQNFKHLQNLFEAELKKIPIPNTPDYLYESIKYTLNLGGKRIRPVLLLSACVFFGGKIKEALDAALGIEIFHNFTLLHDDIMDVAAIRRGQPTVYKQWNQNTAILAGDTMFAMAYQYIVKSPNQSLKQVLEIFTNTAIEVCEGQQLDFNYETSDDVTISNYINMIRLKTSVLLAGSLKIGATIADACELDKNLIYDFGINIGLAFQLKDDLLDLYSNVHKFGKTKGGDVAVGKKSFLYLKALELMENNLERTNFSNLYSDKSMMTDAKIEKVIGIYNKFNIEDQTQKQIEMYSNRAKNILNELKIKGYETEFYENLTDSLVERDY